MVIIKKFTAVQIITKKVNEQFKVELCYTNLNKTLPFLSINEPDTEFNTEEEAIKWAYNENKYGNWLILPLISFEIK